MHVIQARNVSEALLLGLHDVQEYGLLRDSRNGPVRVFPTPVTTVYQKPDERVVFYPERDANPFFHFMESLWMLAGRNDVEFPSRFAANIANYSDDGVTFHGAYGYRWRETFGFDQLITIINALKKNPDDRRMVLQMWDSSIDLGEEGKDFPCNLMALPRIVDGRLDLTVFNRSNDMIWGAYGANAVHFSVLQEVMAAAIGVELGSYYQVSTNFHSYVETFEKHKKLLDVPINENYYTQREVSPFPMVKDISLFWEELPIFMNSGAVIGFKEPIFKKVAIPMLLSHEEYKKKNYQSAVNIADDIAAQDWRVACKEWIIRRAR